MVKNLPDNAGDMGSIPGLGGSPGGGNDNTSIFAWKIPWTEESGGLKVSGVAKSWIQLSTHSHTHIFKHVCVCVCVCVCMYIYIYIYIYIHRITLLYT